MYENGVYVYDQAGFDAIDTESVERVFGLFNESHMQYEADREMTSRVNHQLQR